MAVACRARQNADRPSDDASERLTRQAGAISHLDPVLSGRLQEAARAIAGGRWHTAIGLFVDEPEQALRAGTGPVSARDVYQTRDGEIVPCLRAVPGPGDPGPRGRRCRPPSATCWAPHASGCSGDQPRRLAGPRLHRSRTGGVETALNTVQDWMTPSAPGAGPWFRAGRARHRGRRGRPAGLARLRRRGDRCGARPMPWVTLIWPTGRTCPPSLRAWLDDPERERCPAPHHRALQRDPRSGCASPSTGPSPPHRPLACWARRRASNTGSSGWCPARRPLARCWTCPTPWPRPSLSPRARTDRPHRREGDRTRGRARPDPPQTPRPPQGLYPEGRRRGPQGLYPHRRIRRRRTRRDLHRHAQGRGRLPQSDEQFRHRDLDRPAVRRAAGRVRRCLRLHPVRACRAASPATIRSGRRPRSSTTSSANWASPIWTGPNWPMPIPTT